MVLSTSWVDGQVIHSSDINTISAAINNIQSSALAGLSTYDTTGGTDGASALQTALAADPVVFLQPGSTLLLNSAVFLDSVAALGTSYLGTYVIDGQGSATIKLGSSLPTTSQYTPDTSRGWAIYVNTERTALSGGVVIVDNATMSTGSAFPAMPRLIIRNCIINGQNYDSGLVFGNTAATKFIDCQFNNLMCALSWVGYADGNGIQGGQQYGNPSGSWTIDQITNGDSVIIDGFKGLWYGVWRAVGCNGGHVRNSNIGLFNLQNCNGIIFEGGHWEPANYPAAPVTGIPMIQIDNCQVTFRRCYAYAADDTTVPFILINETSSEGSEYSSHVVIEDPIDIHYYNSVSDPAWSSYLSITNINASSTVEIIRPTGQCLMSGLDLQAGASFHVTSTVTGVQTALASGLIASQGGRLVNRNGTWETVPQLPGLQLSRALVAPNLEQATIAESGAVGTLTAATYYYVMALVDTQGRYTNQSSVQSYTLSATGAIRMIVDANTVPAQLVVWRKSGTGVQTAPTAYVVLPIDSTQLRLYDTGVHIDGVSWITTSVPIPNTVAAVNNTINTILTPGVIQLDSFTGTDDQKLAAAMTYAAAQTHIPAIQFPAREVTLNVGGLTPYSGMKLIGPSGSVGSKNLEIGSGGVLVNHRVHINVGVETAALFNSQTTVYDIHIFDLAFQDGAGVSQFWYQAPGTTLWASEWHGLTFYGFKHVIGSQTNPAPVDALVFTGYWEVIAGTDTQFNLAGSDNSLWRDGLLNLGSARTAGAGVYLMILDLLGKTDIGYMYITVNPGWKAMLLEGNTASGGANFYGGTFEGDQESGQSTTPTTSIIDITGGVWSFFGPRVNYVNGTTGATGVMTQTGGSAHFYDLTYLRDSLTPTPASFPILYQTGGVAQFYGGRSLTTSENLVVRWADTTTNTLLDANLTGNLVDISLAQALLNKNLTSGTNTFPTFNQSTTGNAATATKLATARNINGVAFDGSAAITIADPNAVEVVTYSGSLGATRPSGAQAVYWYNFPSTPTNALAQDIISGGAAMAVATYDPANIAQQVLGTTATQTVTHKNLTDATNTFPTFNQATTGNAGTATALATARTINGVSFNGSANITVTATPTTTTQFYDLSLIGFGQATVRAASSYGDFPFGVKLQRPVTFTSVTFRVNTADASGNLVCQLMKNGSLVSGTSTTIAAASQVAGGTSTGSWSFTTGDIISVYITAVGTTPGNGLIADVTGLA